MTEDRRRRSKSYAVEIIVALGAVLWSGWLLWGSGTPSTQTVSNIGLVAMPFAVTAACVRRALRLTGSLRHSWLLLGASCGAWGLGQSIWTLYETGLGRQVPFPSWADAGYLAAVPLAVAGLLVMPAAAHTMAGFMRIVLDGVMVALALFCTSWILVLGPLFAAGGDNLLTTILGLAYPVGDVVTITMLIFALLRARQGGDAGRQPLYLLGIRLAEAIAGTGKPVVLVLVEGRPRIINRIVDKAGAVLMAYNPGNEGGQAIADVLFGDVNPSGKLPFTYPRTPNGLITYDHKPFETENTAFGNLAFRPQFEFGQGLSYTTFAYSDLRLGQKTFSGNSDLSVSITVTNSGRRAGKEVVQLYVNDLVASLSPAGKRLKRFAKVYLEPGQNRTLTFRLRGDDLSFIGANNKPIIEPGEFEVTIGGLKEKFELK